MKVWYTIVLKLGSFLLLVYLFLDDFAHITKSLKDGKYAKIKLVFSVTFSEVVGEIFLAMREYWIYVKDSDSVLPFAEVLER